MTVANVSPARRRPVFGPMLLTAIVTALVARKDLRDRLIEQLKETAGTVGEVASSAYEDRVQPFAENVGSRVQEVAQDVLHTGSERLGSLQDTVQKSVQSGLGSAQQAVGTVQGLVSDQVEGAQKALEQRAKTARRAAEVAAKVGRKEAMRAIKRARKQGEEVLSKTERRALKQAAKYGLVKERPRTDPVAASLLTVGIVGVGGYLLARSPSVRQGILDAVRSVSPQAADALHGVGRQVRNVIGSVWLERTDPEAAAAPAAPRGGQGASAYSSPAPGSDAAKRADREAPIQVPPTEGETPKPDSTKH